MCWILYLDSSVRDRLVIAICCAILFWIECFGKRHDSMSIRLCHKVEESALHLLYDEPSPPHVCGVPWG